MLYATKYASPLGAILLAQKDGALVGLWFEGQRHFGPKEAYTLAETPLLHEAKAWLDAYFAGANPPVTLPLAPQGTDFQQKVWQEISRIPYGETVTYKEIALRLASSPRAVGTAVGRNPLSLLIPCHRVLGTGGKLTGYAGGIEKKIALLQLEGGFYEE